ncbi:DUF6519 domain-containing protein [Streptomyces melanogenes]|uniref:DUF6519 domain-containing protein n=1 Tax=Streptomyces melanogenes TaxID=67326 RepID=UPI0037A09516
MATITPSSFDPLKRFVNTRLQSGVPIVDADINELDDIRKFELRAFLKWFVGDGVPEGNDGFRITPVPVPAAGDFVIGVGAPAAPTGAGQTDKALRNVGRIVVDGLDALIEADTRYTAQPLHESQAGAAARAAKWGVPVVPALPRPTADATVLVYLDMWERLVTAEEDPSLVRAGLGVESCARTKREWAVRWRTGTDLPKPTDTAEYRTGHSYYPLAQLRRLANVAEVNPGDVVDRRERRMLVPPAHLVADTIGLAAKPASADPVAYRRGENRPAVSLRDAINSLLTGQVLAGPDISVFPGGGNDFNRRALVVDSGGGLVAFWYGPRGANNTNQIIGARLDLARPENGFDGRIITTAGAGGSDVRMNPTAVALPGGGVLVAYQTGPSGSSITDVVMRRASSFAGLASALEEPVAATSTIPDLLPHAVVAGDQVVFFTYQQSSTAAQWYFRRYKPNVGAGTFVETAPVKFTSVVTPTQDLHAATGVDGKVWAAFTDASGVKVARLDPTTADGTVEMLAAVDVSGAPGASLDPFVLPTGATTALVFYRDANGLSMLSLPGPASGSVTPVPIPGTDSSEREGTAVLTDDRTVYLLSSRSVTSTDTEVVLRRRNAASGEWGPPQRVSPHPAADRQPYGVFVPGQGIWVHWTSSRDTTSGLDIYAKRVITTI